MARPKGTTKEVHIRNYPHCADCGVKLGNYRSTKCRKHCLVGKKRPDMVGHTWNNGNKYNAGRKQSDETKRKISEAKVGVPLSIEHREKLRSIARKGAEHHNWKGGLCSQNYKDRRAFKKTIQSLVFKRDDYTCQMCKERGGSIQVDHIKRWAEYPELRFDMNNCRTLCMACHYNITFGRKLPKDRVWGHGFKNNSAEKAGMTS